MLPWEGVSEFVAVAESGGFTSAAKRLGLSTAQISRQVAALEQRLDVQLLYRTTRKVSLTEQGELYYRHCHGVLEGLQEAEFAVSTLQQVPRGLIQMTAPANYGERYVMPVVNAFLERYPELQIHVDLTNQTLDLISGGYDLAIRLGHLRDSSMMAKSLTQRRWNVCASPAYFDRKGVPHSLGELDFHQCLLGTSESWKFMQQGQPVLIKPQSRLRCNSGSALVDAALRGLGLVQLPDYYVRQPIAQGVLREVLTEFQAQPEGVWAVYPRNRHLSSKIRLLVDFLAESLGSLD
jgi:DNA-binding transcriptional LysR family regulator